MPNPHPRYSVSTNLDPLVRGQERWLTFKIGEILFRAILSFSPTHIVGCWKSAYFAVYPLLQGYT